MYNYSGSWFVIQSLHCLLTLIIYWQSLICDKTQSTHLEATSTNENWCFVHTGDLEFYKVKKMRNSISFTELIMLLRKVCKPHKYMPSSNSPVNTTFSLHACNPYSYSITKNTKPSNILLHIHRYLSSGILKVPFLLCGIPLVCVRFSRGKAPLYALVPIQSISIHSGVILLWQTYP